MVGDCSTAPQPGQCTAYSPHHDSLERVMPYLQHIAPVTALIAGILILVMPRLLNYIIALYLIVIGLVGLFGR